MVMKRIISALLLSCGICASAFADAKATFTYKEYDFGYIKEANGPVTCEFELVNTGDKPLIIIEAAASCGCTTPSYPKRPIEPGKKAIIKVTYNPAGRSGGFQKDVRIRTNGTPKRTVLSIVGSTIPKD